MVSEGQAQPSYKVRTHLRTKKSLKKTSVFVNTIFLRIAENQLLALTLMGSFPPSSVWNSLAIGLRMTLIPIRDEQNKSCLERIY